MCAPMSTTVEHERTFACPADDCTYSVRSGDIDELVDQALRHADRGHGERLDRRTVIWQIRMDERAAP